MRTILGYTADEWAKIFVVLKASGKRPTDFCEISSDWMNMLPRTVDEVLKIAALYAEHKGMDTQDFKDVLTRFVATLGEGV